MCLIAPYTSELASSLGFHEVVLGCARPLQHPAPLLFGGPLGVPTSAQDLADPLSVAVTGRPEPASYQTNLGYGSVQRRRTYEDLKCSHKQQHHTNLEIVQLEWLRWSKTKGFLDLYCEHVDALEQS
ncbi:hypothetical protein NQD34_001745 [Periophthalmus magnuspinnatus]|nr:hypothetical protein NQD34_001745 [Periophthalmus magnuspinnatus]